MMAICVFVIFVTLFCFVLFCFFESYIFERECAGAHESAVAEGGGWPGAGERIFKQLPAEQGATGHSLSQDLKIMT